MPRTIMRVTMRDVRPLDSGMTTGERCQNHFASKQLPQTRARGVHRIGGHRPARSASAAEAG